jgi:hypothetical protein
VGDANARIGFSIRTTVGEFCRSFALDSGTAGLACRRDDQWVVDVLASDNSPPTADSFRQAGASMPEAMRAGIEQRMAGEPLTEVEEREQIGRQWRHSGQVSPGER